MATRELASNIGDNITEFGRETRHTTSRWGQGFLDRMLRATGKGASRAGTSIESSAYDLADALPINKERAHTRNTRLALGALMLAGAGTIYRFRQQIGERINQFRTQAETELQPDALDQTGASATPATAQAPTMPAHPVRPPAEQPASERAATTLETGTH